MTELLVNTIKKADGTGSLSVPAESGTVVTTASPSLGRRNILYNGDAKISQRGTSDTVAATTKYVLDRWKHEFNTSGVSITASQDTTDAPTDKGFGYAIKTVVGTAATSGSSNVADIRQALEGQDCQLLRFGTSDAQDATVSFWVRSSVTGTYCCAMRNVDGGVSQVKEYTISSANTWEYKTLTFSGDTTNALDNDNDVSIIMYWDLGTGSALQTGTTDSWVSGAVRSTANQVDWVGTTGATFYLTGVQLEVGSVSTPYEHRSFGDELALCQRYFQKTISGFFGIADTSSSVVFGHPFPVTMRATPTISLYDGTGVRVGDLVSLGFNTTSGSVVSNYGTQYIAAFRVTGFSGLTTYRTYFSEINPPTYGDPYGFDAEL